MARLFNFLKRFWKKDDFNIDYDLTYLKEFRKTFNPESVTLDPIFTNCINDSAEDIFNLN